MKKLIILAATAAALSGCASDAEWAASDPRVRSYVVQGAIVAALNSAQAENCTKLRAQGTPLSPESDAICKKLGR